MQQSSSDGESVGKGCLKVSGGITALFLGIAVAFMIGIFAMCGGCSMLAGRVQEKQAEIEAEAEKAKEAEGTALIDAVKAEIEKETDPERRALLNARLEQLQLEMSQPTEVVFETAPTIEEQIETELTPEERVYREKLAVLMDAAIAAEDAYNAAVKLGTDPDETERLKADLAEKTQHMADFQLGKRDD